MKKFLLFMLLSAMVVACSPYTLKSSQVVGNHNLADYKTFCFQPIDQENLPQGVHMFDVQSLQIAVGKQLAKRGYIYNKDGNADMMVYLSVSLNNHLETDVDNDGLSVGVGYSPYGRYGWGGYRSFAPLPYNHVYYGLSDATVTTEMVTNALLMMDLVECKTNSHLYCAQLSTRIQDKGSIIRDDEELNRAVAVLFKKFPIEVIK